MRALEGKQNASWQTGGRVFLAGGATWEKAWRQELEGPGPLPDWSRRCMPGQRMEGIDCRRPNADQGACICQESSVIFEQGNTGGK